MKRRIISYLHHHHHQQQQQQQSVFLGLLVLHNIKIRHYDARIMIEQVTKLNAAMLNY